MAPVLSAPTCFWIAYEHGRARAGFHKDYTHHSYRSDIDLTNQKPRIPLTKSMNELKMVRIAAMPSQIQCILDIQFDAGNGEGPAQMAITSQPVRALFVADFGCEPW